MLFRSMCFFLYPNRYLFSRDAYNYISNNTHYESVARWMNRNIPEGEIIYHTYWSDAPFFICLNPKNRYIVVLDPIYMLYPYPEKYALYQHLKSNGINYPHKAIRDEFKANYAYADSRSWLAKAIPHYPDNFEILYRDHKGLVARVLSEKEANKRGLLREEWRKKYKKSNEIKDS